MDENEVASFLKGKENFIDGREFLSLTAEEVKEMITPIGLAKKIVRFIPLSKHLSSALPSRQVSIGHQSTATAVTESPSDLSNSSSGTLDSDIPAQSSNSAITNPTSSGFTVTYTDISSISIPENWRPEVMKSIKTKYWTDSSRNEIVRCLGNLLFSVSSKPSRFHCAEIAKKLILKYPSTRDELGNGYQSWSDKLVERIRNVIKRDRIKCGCAEEEETPAAKRPKKETALLSRYPVSAGTDYSTEFAEDAESLAGHIESIKKEMEKDRPRDSLLAQLMKSTYRSRRDLIVTGSVPVAQILQDFPALKRPSMIEQEMCLIMNKTILKEKFVHHWVEVYVSAIIEYGTASTKKALRTLMKELVVDREDDVVMQLIALKVLATALGKGDKSLIYLYKEHNEMERVETACLGNPVHNQPWIAAFLGDGAAQ
ncbi:uncharacterized protein [Dysidea avara]|uniref:uncharacterized protein isoform X2 n=1 Tax=Dysidea avara TaxID=196820 RepID=UPI00331699B3